MECIFHSIWFDWLIDYVSSGYSFVLESWRYKFFCISLVAATNDEELQRYYVYSLWHTSYSVYRIFRNDFFNSHIFNSDIHVNMPRARAQAATTEAVSSRRSTRRSNAPLTVSESSESRRPTPPTQRKKQQPKGKKKSTKKSTANTDVATDFLLEPPATRAQLPTLDQNQDDLTSRVDALIEQTNPPKSTVVRGPKAKVGWYLRVHFCILAT